MLVKIVTLFLVFMVVMGAIQRAIAGPRARDQRRLGRPRRCKRCGRFLIGRGDCGCGK